MFEIETNGWFAPVRRNLEFRKRILSPLTAAGGTNPLVSEFVSQSLNWCSTSLIQLNEERGIIASFRPEDTLSKASQDAVTRKYDAEIKIIIMIQNRILKRNGATVETQDAFLDAIASSVLEALSASAAESNAYNEILTEASQIIAENAKRFDSVRGKLKKITLKFWLSVFGLILGVLVLGVSIFAMSKRKVSVGT